jgi:signal transduction histidine kinase
MMMTTNKNKTETGSGKTNPHSPRWQKFTVQVIALVFLPLTVLGLIVSLGSTSLHQNAMRNLVAERDERAARSVANAINTQLLHRADLMRSLAIRGSEATSLDEVLQKSAFLDQEFDLGLAFLSTDGSIISSRGDLDNWVTILDIAQYSMDDKDQDLSSEVHITNAMPFPNSENYVVLIYTYSDQKDQIAVGAFSVASIAFQPLNSAFDPGEHASAVVIDSERRIVFSLGDNTTEHFDASHPGVSEVQAGKSGASYFPVNGDEHVIAYSVIPLVEWGVVIEEPWESVTNPVLNTTLLAPLVLIPVLILSLAALWFGARRVIQPLQSLEDRAAKLAWGDFQAIEEPVDGIEEINRLQHTLIHMSQKVQLAQQGLRGYIGAMTAGQEDERSRLARELHDDTIQSLIALGQRVQLTRIKLADGQLTDTSLVEIQELNEQNIKELRRITRDLRPLYLEDLGLVAALDMLARETSKETGIEVDFQRIGNEHRLMPEIGIAFYRMAQEGLSNIIRHADASRASIVINFNPVSTTLTISDDGKGFAIPESPAEFAPGGHYGLLGLYERADLIGANLEIRSSPDHGTQLVITLPVVEEEELSRNSS